MALNISDEAERAILTKLLTTTWATQIRLFQSNLTLDATTTTATLNTAVANYSGYLAQPLTWGAVTTDGTGRAFTLSVDVTFPKASSGSQIVYGFYAVGSSPADHAFARKFDSPVTITTTAGVDTFAVKFTLRQEP